MRSGAIQPPKSLSLNISRYLFEISHYMSFTFRAVIIILPILQRKSNQDCYILATLGTILMHNLVLYDGLTFEWPHLFIQKVALVLVASQYVASMNRCSPPGCLPLALWMNTNLKLLFSHQSHPFIFSSDMSPPHRPDVLPGGRISALTSRVLCSSPRRLLRCA